MNAINVLFALYSLIVGVLLGGFIIYITRRILLERQMRIAQRKAIRTVAEARAEAKNVVNEAREESNKIKGVAENEYKDRRNEITKQENRLAQKIETLERKLDDLTHRERNLNNKEKEVDAIRVSLEESRGEQLKRLELVSGMSTNEAKQVLMEKVQGELQEEASRRLHEWEIKVKEDEDRKSQEILAMAIQRSASEIAAETTVATVPIPNDEMKGRLIGREGRNIRTLEQATGVDLIIDDTPEAVTLSSFDPVRREIARLTLTKLIANGRIHPARIEEVVAKTKEEVEATMVTAGEQAAYQVGVQGLRPELIKLLGRLKYRTSYGQNVLAHSIEVAYMAGMIASEIGANVTLAKRSGLLHDIGKAVDRQVEGTHAAIGAELVKQWDKSPEVVAGIAEHHLDGDSVTLWGYIISAADAISGARPGARRESLEGYLKRLKALEDIANSFKGVEKSYAIQAGREVRILVKPEEIDDLGAMRLARDIVKKIEDGVEYPGQIKVTVLRETRATDYAK